MGGKKKSHDGKYVPWAILFICCVIFIIAASFAWKAAIVYSESRFDGKSQYILGLDSVHASSIIVFSPSSSKISDIYIDQESDAEKVANVLNIPLDKVMRAGNLTKNTFPNLLTLNINAFDKIRLWTFLKSVKNGNVEYSYMRFSDLSNNADNLIPNFTDNTLYSDGETIEVINAGSIFGEGSKVGRMLTNIGANVISVTSSDSMQNTTTIQYVGNDTYTLKRMEKIFGVDAKKLPSGGSPTTIADIIITIGESYK